jgi:APA family basic amino acid/polyamine antiporter
MVAFERKKGIAARPGHSSGLLRTLRWPQLIMLGVGAIVGTGIYTLVGVGAGLAGPSLILTFGLAGSVCMLAVLTYAEVATLVPSAGGAYAFTYAGLGRGLAWIVGWSLVLEYSIASAAVAVGWSAYAVRAIAALGFKVPLLLSQGPPLGGRFNVPAAVILLLSAWMLSRGARIGAWVTTAMVILKIGALALFVAIAALAFKPSDLAPFMPYGFLPHEVQGKPHGTLAAAAIVFFAFFGFDAIATTAEETENPRRDVPAGLLGTVFACTLIYVAVSVASLGAVRYSQLADDAGPLAAVMAAIGRPDMAVGLDGVAVLVLPAAILSLMYGQSRLLFAMSRDGLLPQSWAAVDANRGSPQTVILVTTVVIVILAGLLPLDEIAALANAGTLTAFVAVPMAALVLRRRWPSRPRAFRCPALWLVAPLAMLAGCLLFASLPAQTLWRFSAWNVFGLAFYFGYGRRRSSPPQFECAAESDHRKTLAHS